MRSADHPGRFSGLLPALLPGLLLVLILLDASARAEDVVAVAQAFPHLTIAKPLAITEIPDGSGRMVVVSQWGKVVVFPRSSDGAQTKTFLEITVSTENNEEGLLSIAFPPSFTTSHLVYVYYAAAKPRHTVLARFHIDPSDPDRVLPDSQEILLTVAEPFGNHKGGTILFDRSGLLYLSLGDGGAGGDPYGNGQNLGVMLGKILRLDVDHPADGKPYGIPTDNPFLHRPGALPEIYAYGLRNTWRMSFDRTTGELWAGDVGQNIWEEVDVIVKGGNYGWNSREGTHQFEKHPPIPGAIDPVIDYNHNIGVSITGGYVYRGKAIPQLRGVYLYADYGTGRLWGLRRDSAGTVTNAEILQRTWHPTSFGEDADGELYITSYEGQNGSLGRIYRLVPR